LELELELNCAYIEGIQGLTDIARTRVPRQTFVCSVQHLLLLHHQPLEEIPAGQLKEQGRQILEYPFYTDEETREEEKKRRREEKKKERMKDEG